MKEYQDHYRKGMGTENVGPLLRSLIRMVRPHRSIGNWCWIYNPLFIRGVGKK